MNVRVVDGDLLKAEDRFIVHQCNCVTSNAAHLAKSVFDAFPWSDIYSERRGFDVPLSEHQPGGIVVRGEGRHERLVIAILGQYYPGRSKYPEGERDGLESRRGYFRSGLEKILLYGGIDTIAFPFGIGCGAAGGDWGQYFEMLEWFAEELDGEVTIYRYGG